MIVKYKNEDFIIELFKLHYFVKNSNKPRPIDQLSGYALLI